MGEERGYGVQGIREADSRIHREEAGLPHPEALLCHLVRGVAVGQGRAHALLEQVGRDDAVGEVARAGVEQQARLELLPPEDRRKNRAFSRHGNQNIP